MTRLSLSLAALLSLSLKLSVLQAAILTVDNRPGRAADFDDLQDAIDAAIPGDTIYVVGSEFSYGDITVNKPNLTFVGPGYLLEQNGIVTTNLEAASIEDLTITSAADGTTVVGIFTGRGAFTLTINANNATFRRCRIGGRTNINSVDSTTFISCTTGFINSSFRAINTDSNSTNIFISNCIIDSLIIDEDSEAVIDQSVIGGISGGATLENCRVRNSIFTRGLTNNGGNDIQFCLSAFTLAVFGENNIGSVNMATVFTGWTTAEPSLDGRWALIQTSDAVGFGDAGQDIGVFAGATPYVISGVPPLPSVTSITAPPLIVEGQDLVIEIEATANP